MNSIIDGLSKAISFEGIGPLLAEGFVQRALVAAALLGITAGLLAPFVAMRNMAFAVHGSAELATAGAAAALLAGTTITFGAICGSVIASLLFGFLGGKTKERDATIGIVLAFGLGLGVLFLSLQQGRGANKFGLLVGQIVSVDVTGIKTLAVGLIVVVVAMAVIYRPLTFASCDPLQAQARGVTRWLTPIFAVLLGLTVAFAVQVVGAILVLSVMVTPGAAAARVTSRPWLVTVLSIVFAETALVGGVMLSLAPGLPTSPYVTSISFAIYLLCRTSGRRDARMRV